MVFSSAISLFFFVPIVFLLDRRLSNVDAKNTWLLLASLVFYSFGQVYYLPLLLLSVALNYVCGRLAAGKYAKLGVTLAVIGGIGLLAVFKYADFAIRTVNALCGLHLPLTGIALPIGISFFTFQGLSYVIDVYREPKMVSHSFKKVLLYIAFFPQLIAGPIVKYHDVEQEIDSRRTTPQETVTRYPPVYLRSEQKAAAVERARSDGGYRVRAACRRDRHAGRMDGRHLLHAADLFRFFRLQRYGHRSRTHVRLPFPRKLQLSVHRDHHQGVLAPLAHFAVWLVPRLSVYSAWRQPKGECADVAQPFSRIFRNRPVARRKLDVRPLGTVARLVSVLEDCGAIPVDKLKGKRIGQLYTLLVVVLGFTLFRADTLAQAGAMYAAMFSGIGLHWLGTAAVWAKFTPAFALTLCLALLLCTPVPVSIRRNVRV